MVEYIHHRVKGIEGRQLYRWMFTHIHASYIYKTVFFRAKKKNSLLDSLRKSKVLFALRDKITGSDAAFKHKKMFIFNGSCYGR